jgi:hypothetical protein
MPECKYGRSTQPSRLRPLGLCLKRPCKTGLQPPCKTRKSRSPGSARTRAFTELQNIAKTARHRRKQTTVQSELAHIGRNAHKIPKQRLVSELKEDNKPIVLTIHTKDGNTTKFIGRYKKRTPGYKFLEGVHNYPGKIYQYPGTSFDGKPISNIQYAPIQSYVLKNNLVNMDTGYTWNYIADEDRSIRDAFDRMKLQELTKLIQVSQVHSYLTDADYENSDEDL